jgi:hypothetical protein
VALGDNDEPGLRIGPYIPRPNDQWSEQTRSEQTPSERPVTEAARVVDAEPWASFVDDSWDRPAEQSSGGPYRGIRRAGSRRRVWLVSLAVLPVLGVVAAIGLAALSGSPRPDAPAAGAPVENTSVSPSQVQEISAAAEPSISGVAATATPVDPSTSGGPPFKTVIFEAEAGPPTTKLRGSARTVEAAGASGGHVVQGIGNWGQEAGSVQFRGLTIPTKGTYRIALTYIADDSSAGRTVNVELGSVSATATFDAGSGCCSVSTVDIELAAGSYVITLGNPDGPVPPIDKVAISRP